MAVGSHGSQRWADEVGAAEPSPPSPLYGTMLQGAMLGTNLDIRM
ncbi:MAG TPA: hypothetical protein VGK74_27450 [Symbiobacteriaceae bacterium]